MDGNRNNDKYSYWLMKLKGKWVKNIEDLLQKLRARYHKSTVKVKEVYRWNLM